MNWQWSFSCYIVNVKFIENVEFLDFSTEGNPINFYFSAEIQNFIEYFYPLSLNSNADFPKINA